MADFALKTDPLDELRQLSDPDPDRLPAMLFLAALLHGILIVGVTFNPAMLEDFSDAISLEVTIVADPDQDIDRPDRAEYLAQASQEGGGNTTEQVRPSAPAENASPIDNPGDDTGGSFIESTEHQISSDQLIATVAEQERSVTDDPRLEPQPDSHSALALESGAEMTLPLPQDDRATLLIHDDDPRQLVISADTRESVVAAYLDSWKRRIESVGDDYFPTLGKLAGLTGSPTLEVSIDASGRLADVIIRKSSGSRILDQAALDILRRASPFDPFPAAISAEYDSLRFAYKWLFSEEIVPATASVARQ
jgi:protein TonB